MVDIPKFSSEIRFHQRTLMVFVDDTGHEDLAPGHPIYGLGGCAVLGRDFDRLIQQPWREIRKRVTGSPNTPLHANKFSGIANKGDMEAVAKFFREHAFYRFGATVSVNTTLPADLSRIRP